MRTIAVIQSRMGSTRLPGKMMEELAGEPLIHHIIKRALAIKLADEVILATTTARRDEALCSVAQSLGVRAVRGSEANVLSRFFLALEGTGADYLVRICGDAPLFHPPFLDRIITTLTTTGADILRQQKTSSPNAYQGAGVISVRALEWTRDHAGDDPLAIEHVTAYASTHHEELETAEIEIEPEMVGQFHLSIDTHEDLEAIRAVYDRLYRPGEIVSLPRALELIRGEGVGGEQILRPS